MTDNSLPRRESPGQQQPHIYRPIPRRTFSPQIPHDQGDSPTHALAQQPHSPTTSSLQSSRSSDFLAQLNARLLRTYNARTDDATPESPVEGALGSARGLPRQNKSFLNMNSSTLFGIYDDVGASTHGAASVAETPWGTGAETPGHTAMGWSGTVYDAAGGADAGGLSMKKSVRRGSTAKGRAVGIGEKRGGSQTRRARGPTARYAVLVAKLAALFTFGVLYGTIVSHLHDTRHLAAVHIKGLDRENGFYITVWGCAGVALGSLLPYVDLVWSRHSALTDSDTEESESPEDEKDAESPISEQINDVVRSVAAFLGVAFAIRRLPWQSTLQLTLTLALVNPALWYILDRSKPGLTASLLVTSLLTTLLFLSNPTALPTPYDASPSFAAKNATNSGSPASAAQRSHLLFAGLISYENLAVVTWVGSVLFCSCVCFGSIGRRLGLVGKK